MNYVYGSKTLPKLYTTNPRNHVHLSPSHWCPARSNKSSIFWFIEVWKIDMTRFNKIKMFPYFDNQLHFNYYKCISNQPRSKLNLKLQFLVLNLFSFHSLHIRPKKNLNMILEQLILEFNENFVSVDVRFCIGASYIDLLRISQVQEDNMNTNLFHVYEEAPKINFHLVGIWMT